MAVQSEKEEYIRKMTKDDETSGLSGATGSTCHN